MCLGHAFRTDELYPCRKLTFTNPEGTRKVGPNPIVLKNALKDVVLTTGKPRQETEWTGEAKLGRSRMEQGCSTSMTMMGVQQRFNVK